MCIMMVNRYQRQGVDNETFLTIHYVLCSAKGRGKTTKGDMSFKNLKCPKEDISGPLTKQHIIQATHGSNNLRQFLFPKSNIVILVMSKNMGV